MYGYPWDYFPGRLHSTREIVFFLENITTIKEIISNNPEDLTNFIFGDIYHPDINEASKKWLNTDINRNINKIVIEISSRKVRYYNDIPLNYFYSQTNINTQYNLVSKILTDEEIDYDLAYIAKLCRRVFNENIEVHIIPHLNLRIRSTNEYIFERSTLVNLLEQVCNKYNIQIHNVGKYIEEYNGSDSFIEEYMEDSTHYNKDSKQIKAHLINEIILR